MSVQQQASSFHSFLANELRFYREEYREKLISFVPQCYEIINKLGGVYTMEVQVIEYIIKKEVESIFSTEEDRCHTAGLVCSLIHNYELSKRKSSVEADKVKVENILDTKAPLSPFNNPMVSAIFTKSRPDTPPGLKKNNDIAFPKLNSIKPLAIHFSAEDNTSVLTDIPTIRTDITSISTDSTIDNMIVKNEALLSRTINSESDDMKPLYVQILKRTIQGEESPATSCESKENKPLTFTSSSRENTHFFKYVNKSGFVDPVTVDGKLQDIGYTVLFNTENVNEDHVQEYLRRNYPRTEYYSTFSKIDSDDSNSFRVRITFNGMPDSKKIESMVDSKLENQDYVDIFTTYSYEKFVENLEEGNPEYKKKYFLTSKQIDDRITSIRFLKFVPKEFVLPTRSQLNEQFKSVSEDKTKVAFVSNIPENIFQTLKGGKLHGYKFILTKNQPEDSQFKNILVFAPSKK